MTRPNVEVVTSSDDGDVMELGKRTYVPGVVLKSTCPKCGTPWEKHLSDEYLTIYSTGRPHDAHGYCANDACGHEWPVMVVVRLTVEAAPEKNT